MVVDSLFSSVIQSFPMSTSNNGSGVSSSNGKKRDRNADGSSSSSSSSSSNSSSSKLVVHERNKKSITINTVADAMEMSILCLNSSNNKKKNEYQIQHPEIVKGKVRVCTFSV